MDAGSVVGAPVRATDADNDDDEQVLTYWLSGPDMAVLQD